MAEKNIEKVVETLLLVSNEPLSIKQLLQMINNHPPGGEAVNKEQMLAVLQQISAAWQERGLALVEVADGWRFVTRPELAPYIQSLLPEQTPRYSRAILEVLAVIAYRQPVTRADIEQIRGVALSSTMIKQLEERGWVEVVGHRNVPGQPALWGTTQKFLNDLGLQTLHDLPSSDEHKNPLASQLLAFDH